MTSTQREELTTLTKTCINKRVKKNEERGI